MANNNEQIKSLLKRVEIFIEDKDVSKANEYCERILDIDPNNADAYKYKLLLDLGIENEDEILDKDYLKVVSNNNYQRYIKNLPEKERKNIEDKWNSIAYTIANNYLAANDLKNAKKIFESLKNYNDSNEKLQEINDLLENKSNETKKKLQKYKRIIIPVVAVLILLIVIINTYFFKKFLIDANINRGSYQVAIDSINKLDKEKRDSSEMTTRTNYCKGMLNYEKANYGEAISYLEKAGSYADSVKKAKESKFLNAESKWKEGYLKEAYIEMKRIYNSDKSFNVNGKTARDYLVEWVKEKDRINMLGEYTPNFVLEGYMALDRYGNYNNSVEQNEKNESRMITEFESNRIVGNTIYFTLSYTLMFNSTNRPVDGNIDVLQSMLLDDDFSYKLNFSHNISSQYFSEIKQSQSNGYCSVTNIDGSDSATVVLFNVARYKARNASVGIQESVFLKRDKSDDIYDTIDTFIDTSTYKEGFNGNMYKKSNGDLAKNEWVEDNGEWYYFNNDKVLEKNKWVGNFYVDENGKMLKDTTTPDGYLVGKDGKAVVNKIADDKTIYNDQGKIVKNGWVQINGSYYYTDSDGKYLSNTWVDGGNYYVGSDGKMLKNATTPDGRQVDASGKKMKTFSEQVEAAKLVSSYPKDTLVEQMDTVIFGSYPQSDASGNKKDPIEWIVLSKDETKALLLSKYILDNKKFHDKNETSIWSKYAVRNWLNNEFYNSAFVDGDKSKIISTHLTNNKNSDYGTDGGESTIDNVFCLSIDDVREYFYNGEFEKRTYGYTIGKFAATKVTEYAKNVVDSNGMKLVVKTSNPFDYEYEWAVGNCGYYLRSPGYNQRYCSDINSIGLMGTYGGTYNSYDSERTGVRPAMWVKYK